MFTEVANHLEQEFQPFIPCPPASDRAVWERLPEDLKNCLVVNGESWLGYQFPTILITDYLEFSRTGNRSNYEKKMFERRNILNALVLAECVEYQGRFLDDILNAVFLMCGESAWQLPAHNVYVRDTPQFPIPDMTRPVFDLDAGETATDLALTRYLLGEAFDKISPVIAVDIQDHLEHRVFQPYLTEHFWWMGNGKEHVNNWTSWCTQNVLIAAFLSPLPEETRTKIVGKACQSLDYFLAEYEEDGCCDEGAQYYRHAGLTLFNAIEVLNGISGHAFDCVYENQKVKNIADYIRKVHVDDIYYVNFADCSPIAGRCNAREFLFGKRTGNAELMAFAAMEYQKSEDPLLLQEKNLFYRIQTIFTHEEMWGYEKDAMISHPDIFFKSAGLFLTRDERYVLAVKGGDNDDSHNHNDVGSFTVYKDGKPMFIDVGVESYTKKTFSPQRYEIWTMQSQYHNLPVFDGVMQMNGPEYAASDVEYELSDSHGWISMELAGAYPGNTGSYKRHASLEKGKGITIQDTYDGPCQSVVLSLMTYEKPVFEGQILTVGSLGTCQITGAGQVEIEEIPVTDPRLALTWKHSIYRTRVTMEGMEIRLEIE